MANLLSTQIASTGILKLPSGDTASRPGSAVSGAIRYNTQLGYTEVYTGTSWAKFTAGAGAELNIADITTSSGTHQAVNSNGYRIHNFLSGSHTFTPRRSGRVEVLVVAGGGAGGWDVGGGGGGGGVVYSNTFEVVANTGYTVTVGEGGAAPTGGGGNAPNGANSVFGTLTAIGGGGGGNWSTGTGADGGSGGGSTSNQTTRGAALQPASASGGYGNPGGFGGNNTNNRNQYMGASGGGGAGGPGGNGNPDNMRRRDPVNGVGGPGIPCDISGQVKFYGGGGGAVSDSSLYYAFGGVGGGGRGNGFNGEPNTGGGGGGGGLYDVNGDNQGGRGGSGVVVVRYLYEAPSVCQSFTTLGTHAWKCPTGVTSVEVLVIGGGGGGGFDMGGGGGAGGYYYNPAYPVSAGTWYTLVVGAGGNGAPKGANTTPTNGLSTQGVSFMSSNTNAPGNVAQGTANHQFTTAATAGGSSQFGVITVAGGGFGGSSVQSYTPGWAGGSGASGGGASGYNSTAGAGAGAGTAGIGFIGGQAGGNYYSGGGGGSGAAGVSGTGRPLGGVGKQNSILGYPYFWAGGGGGAGYSAYGGSGGLGGGGAGAVGYNQGGYGYRDGEAAPDGYGRTYDGGGDVNFIGLPSRWANTPGGNAGPNTGGGGGAGAHYNGANQGGNGGSGIVVIRWTPSV